MREKGQFTPDTAVGPHAVLVGRINVDQSLCIYGTFAGDLEATDAIFVDKEGLVKADITAEHVIVQGAIVGDIHAEQVDIDVSGKIWGNVCAESFNVKPGGFIRGQITISSQAEREMHIPSWKPHTAPPVLPPPPALTDDDDGADPLLAELEAAVRNAAAAAERCSDARQPPAEQGTGRDEDSRVQASIAQLRGDLTAAHQRIEQLAAERDELRATTAQLGRDLEAAKQQVQLSERLTQAQIAVAQPTIQQGAIRAKRGGAQDITAQLATDPGTARCQVSQPANQIAEEDTKDVAAESLEAEQEQTERQPRTYVAYCLTCRTQRPMVEVQEVATPDGRRAIRGRCTGCGIIFLSRAF
jgi:cytoskeletal protein CcmA (bactofilin family)